MKWIENNLTTISLFVLNIIQAVAILIKTIVDRNHTKRMDEQTKQMNNQVKEQQDRYFELQKSQMNLQSEANNLQNKVELRKAELAKQKELTKVKLSNQQFSYEKAFPRVQEAFETFVTITRGVLKNQSFLYKFPSDYQSKISLVLLYCPSIDNDIDDFIDTNIPYDKSNTDLSEEEYNNEMSKFMNDSFEDIVKKLSNQLYHKE
ncbi:hypothetical protein L2520_07895 [Limosilactobacillus vaginalis]|uniref:Uncharacterized protein n=1 Tax=Limosilactobacillus vaginalis TaxID=1633 RepID=A0ABT4K5P4_9LACO|nr:hypothetical protein [Limosilactobacillus vaginalis]MCZ3746303.1 hypothetical protein [Limosilactobacillus vaginalis]MCZ3751285.1 hypothetical protein [Limosilactobacillus vaginalis]MCZ3752897.1 hypothetical protein [Limosilactobacillus vaginalis]MCZ3755716.1 hypothetical protein [Limosilactobacillus vaginalis]MCZ3756344.1 hypothetical protein [Limosilactobacillus vaginalis]